MEEDSIYQDMTKPEKKVAEYLEKLGIAYEYERPVFVFDEKDRPRVWTPDFFLFEYGMYVEVCGREQFDYEYRNKIYTENGYPVIYLHLYKAEDKWKNHFLQLFFDMDAYRQEALNKVKEKIKK